MAEVILKLSNMSSDIIIFTEARAETDRCLLDGNLVLFISGSRDFASGVEIRVSSQNVQRRMKIHRMSDRVMSVDMAFHGKKYRVVAIYLPHAGYDESFIFEIYGQVQVLIDQALQNSMNIIVGGDFQMELNQRLSRDQILLDWLAENNLISSNSFCCYFENQT